MMKIQETLKKSKAGLPLALRLGHDYGFAGAGFESSANPAVKGTPQSCALGPLRATRSGRPLPLRYASGECAGA